MLRLCRVTQNVQHPGNRCCCGYSVKNKYYHMKKRRSIELLAPAKNAECAKQAILHGADAIYIGAPKFGARSAAGNSIEDIAEVVEFAHIWNAKVYVTLNVVLFDDELQEAEDMIWKLWRIGVDALIIQDMGITKLNLPPVPLHASTQMDNRTVEKVQFLEGAGFQQVVLARELSLDQIRKISSQTTVTLESFVHGALCVSYSGQCYLSMAMSGRSANRGECAQYCRLPYDLIDADGNTLIKAKHLLSLKDLNLSDSIEDLIDAGISSFKIEGRLKDIPYVKNITAWYRQQIDRIVERRPDLERSSYGASRYTFDPDPEKSFNRGFTKYFIDGRNEKMSNPDTPKSMGEMLGVVKKVNDNKIVISEFRQSANGDGLSFFNNSGKFDGCRVNKVDGNTLFMAKKPSVKHGTVLYRTYDKNFCDLLEKPSAKRYIPVTISCIETPSGFSVWMEDNRGHRAAVALCCSKELAQKPQKNHVCMELSKLGDTIYEAESCNIDWKKEWFVPVSRWTELRRQLCGLMDIVLKLDNRRIEFSFKESIHPFIRKKLTYLDNVTNTKAADFYAEHGVESVEPGFESNSDEVMSGSESTTLMFNKFCLKYELGYCPKNSKIKTPVREPLYLVQNERKIRLAFDCKACEMHLELVRE